MAPIKKRTNIRAKIAAKSRPAPINHNPISDLSASTGGAFDNDDADESTEAFSSFANSKKDKRVMKHSAFMSKIEKSQKKPLKRGGRRKNQQLATKLEGLVDALPEIEGGKNGEDEDDGWEGMSEDDADMMTETAAPEKTSGSSKEDDMLGALAGMVNIRKSIKKSNPGDGGSGAASGDAKMKMKTLKSRPGAAKRKAALEGREMERFAKNMAQMAQPSAAPAAAAVATQGQGQGGDATSNRWAALRGFIGQTMEKNPSFGKQPAV